MKSVKIQPGINWHAIKPEYQHDQKIRIDSNNVMSKDGVTLNICDVFGSTVDVSTNNQSQLIMLDNVKMHDLFKVDVNIEQYPEQFTTYLLCLGFPTYNGDTSYLKIVEQSSTENYREYVVGSRTIDGAEFDTVYYNADLNSDNGLYFSITLHDENHLSINHNDNYENVYMTTSGTPINNTDSIYFESLVDDTVTNNKKFNYIIDREQGYLIMYKEFSGVKYYVTPARDSQNEIKLTFTPASGAVGFNATPYDSVMRVKAENKQTVTGIKLLNTWVSYTTHDNLNKLSVNETKSYSNINNNYVLTSPVNLSVSGSKQYNVLQLKNQTTPNNKQSRKNPFPNFLPCDHREYDKLFTGTNQINGQQNITLGYNSYITTIDLEPDNITYFHTPQDMYPYNKININDSGLIEAGAIGGDSPIISDKIFKKAADYKYNTPYGAPSDEETGVWLCAWLRSNTGTEWNKTARYEPNVLVNFRDETYKCLVANTNIQPNLDNTVWKSLQQSSSMWVDRYYNPEYYTATQALQVEDQYVKYSSKFEYIVDKLKTDKHIVFDKKSDLCFEPGCMYAYYRIGEQENNSVIKTSDGSMIHEGVTPTYTQDRVVYLNDTPDTLILTGEHYVETTAKNKTTNSDFTLSLHLKPNDWTKPFASQIAGNYTNNGIGLFNRINVTPYSILIGDMCVDIYNTSLDHVIKITLDHQPLKVMHLEGSENLYIYSQSNLIYQYDVKGMLVEKFQLPTDHNLIDVEIDDECIYTLDSDNNIRKYDLNNELQDELYEVWPNLIIGQGTDPTGEPYVTSPQTHIVPYKDQQYRVNCDNHTMDLSGNMWFTKGNKVYKMIPDEQLGINATFVDIVNGVLISLVTQERNLGATKGNVISITANGVDTLSEIIQNWNDANTANKIEALAFESLDLVLPSGYVIDFTGGVDRGTSTITYGMSGAINHDIVDIKSDEHDHLWLLSQQGDRSYIYKFSPDRRLLFCNCLSAIDSNLQFAMSGDCCLDMVSEFVSGGHVHDAMVMNRVTNSTNVICTRINTNGELSESTTKSVDSVSYKSLKSYNNITNFDPLKNLYGDTILKNHVIFKIRYQNYFDTDKTFTRMLKYDVSKYTSNSHHFAVSFNSTNGNLSFFADGQLQLTALSDDPFTGAGYKQTKTIHSPLYIGSDTFFNNITLSEHLKLNNYNFAGDCDVYGLRVYNEYLNFHRISALAREFQNIQPVNLTLPTGKRSYLDQANKFYHHRTPGRRSTMFDINIITQALSGDRETQKLITDNVSTQITTKLPVNTNINNINWIT